MLPQGLQKARLPSCRGPEHSERRLRPGGVFSCYRTDREILVTGAIACWKRNRRFSFASALPDYYVKRTAGLLVCAAKRHGPGPAARHRPFLNLAAVTAILLPELEHPRDGESPAPAVLLLAT